MRKRKNSPIEKLSDKLANLPGVGERTAQRLAYHIARLEGAEGAELAEAIRDVQKRVQQCSNCCLLSEEDPCQICSDPGRDKSRICVVENSRDAWAIESSGKYKGLYHVLGGRLAPLDGMEPEHLNIPQLVRRVKENSINEIILATNPDMEGDTTAGMIKDAIGDQVKLTRLARGLPSGSNLEYANSAVLSEAMEGRREMDA